MERMSLNVKTRVATGKGVAKKMREEGIMPAVMYNSKGEAKMLQVNFADFTKVWKLATPTTLISLIVDDEKPQLAFIKSTEYDIITDKNLHADFHVIDENKQLVRSMKIRFSGNPVGVRDGGVFEKKLFDVKIKCLPKDLPPRIVADVSGLALNQELLVKDLPFEASVTVVTPADEVIASVRPMR